MPAVRVNRQELLAALGRIEPGLTSSDTIPQSSCVVLRDGWFCSYNEEICCRTKVDLPKEWEGAIPAKPLVKALEAVRGDEVDVSVTAKEFRVRAGKDKFWLRLQSEVLLPIDAVESPKGWRPVHEDFAKTVDQVVEAAGKKADEFLTLCVHIHPEWLEASDRYQIARYSLPTGVERPYLVRAASLKKVAPLWVTKQAETENWLHFRNKNLVMSVRRHLDDFPDLTPMLKFRGHKASLPAGAVSTAKLAAVFCADDKENDKVTVTLSAGRMTVEGEGSHGGSEASEAMEYKGDPVTFRISPKKLIQLVENTTECEVAPTRLRVDGEGWVFVSLLGKPRPKTEETGRKKREPVAAGVEE